MRGDDKEAVEGDEKQYPVIPRPNSCCSRERRSEGSTLLSHYFNSYSRLLREHRVLNNQLELIEGEKKELEERVGIAKLEEEERHKRRRRPANEIARNFKCPADGCGKSYGSEGSMLQHIKLKHEAFYNSE